MGVNVRVKFGDSRLNLDRIIQLFDGHAHVTHFCAELIAASELISGRFAGMVVPDK